MPSTYERSFVKGMVWEGIAFILTALLVYFVYGNVLESIKTGIILTLIKIPFYFIHERIWKKIKWGKIKHEPRKSLLSSLPFHSHNHYTN